MSPHLTWSKLIPGLIALGLLVALAASVIVFGGVGRIRGNTMRLHVVTDQARGLMKGSDVWLNGQRAGSVADIEFLPAQADSAGRIVVVLDVMEAAAVQIRRDSDVQIRAGGNVIGPVVVYIAAGSTTSPRVASGDTIRARSQSDFEGASATLAAAADELGPIAANVKRARARLDDTSGSIGAALGGSTGPDVSRLRANVGHVRDRFAGRSAGDATLLAASRSALARVDSVRALLASRTSSVGRFRRDSTLGDVIAGIRDELTELRARAGSNDGTLGRLSNDSALVRRITDARREMAALFADVRRHPTRYIAF